jgi:4-aminobutyrate aminotransferase-like enzyme/Ser/Thr protein kinase RdoA (MazF antagonist)
VPREPASAARTSDREAVELAATLYKLSARASPLPGEYDDNFLLEADDARRYVLKVMHPERERALVELQCAALAHLASRAPDLELPRVVLAANGAPIAGTHAGGAERLAWLLEYVDGHMLAHARPQSPELLASVGGLLGRMDRALLDFSHPAAQRDLKWDLSRPLWIRGHLGEIGEPPRRKLIERFLCLYQSEVVPALAALRRSVIHGDANDYNVLVGGAAPQPRQARSVIDFGDMHRGLLVAEAAVAAAYAIFGKSDPIAAAAQLVAGYHAALPLEEAEIAQLYPLIGTRLCVSVVNSAVRKRHQPADPYLTISEAPAWEALAGLAETHPRLAHYRFRDACGLPPFPAAPRVVAWLKGNGASAAPVLEHDLRSTPSRVVDLSVGGTFLGADPRAASEPELTRHIVAEMERAGVPVAIGRYDEARAFSASELFGASLDPTQERRTIHLGIDLFVRAGSRVQAPLDGTLRLLANNAAPLDYGPLVVLAHEAQGVPFFTLYGHLSDESLRALSVGQRVSRGQEIGRVGVPPANGGWTPHLHFQIILDLLELDADFPGVAYASQREVWKSLCPDPNLLLGIPADRFPEPAPTAAETLARRRERIGRNLRLSYRRPLQIVRGFAQHLYDDTARAYLDLYNNVPLVGHSHPRVVRAVQRQLALLNTNTRYLHDNVVRYAERLTARLPAPLRVCFFVNSGSEANELALRLARAHTRREGVVVLEHAYHGHTGTLIDVSPYKFDGPGGRGRKPWVHVAALPDDYRGPHRREHEGAGERYARELREQLRRLDAEGRPPAAYLVETIPSVAGQVVLPAGYLARAYDAARAVGAVCMADEVQTGFARVGTHIWAFEAHGVVPDVLVLGKPIGNGFPLGAVITSEAIAASFDDGMEFFSTFGGNPVACAAGLAVLEVVEEEGLQERAARVGGYLADRLRELQRRQPLIGDVRGSGLFLGVDLVRDRETRAPATAQADYVVNRLRELGLLTGSDGPAHNVLKLRPPLVFGERDADLFVSALDEVLREDAAQAC